MKTYHLLAAALSLLTLNADATNCLWKATSGEATLYIQGSVHLLKPDNYPLDPAIESAYSNATVMVFEVDPAEMSNPRTARLLMEKAMLKPPQRLQDTLKPATFEKLKQAFKDTGGTIDLLQQTEPWFATMMLALAKMQALEFNAELGLDRHLHRRALSDKKQVIGLETIEFQIGLFDSLGESNPDEVVLHALDDLDLLDDELPKLLKAWENGDIKRLEELMTDAFKEYPELYDSFITKRNRNWVKQVKQLLQAGDDVYMITVGAAHLAGDDGLLNLFAKEGFTLEQQ